MTGGTSWSDGAVSIAGEVLHARYHRLKNQTAAARSGRYGWGGSYRRRSRGPGGSLPLVVTADREVRDATGIIQTPTAGDHRAAADLSHDRTAAGDHMLGRASAAVYGILYEGDP